jgi:phosphatidylserine/phosphatidylglycerophosphate/cardiolipin synthase-like enzyme
MAELQPNRKRRLALLTLAGAVILVGLGLGVPNENGCGGSFDEEAAADEADLAKKGFELYFTNPLPDLITRGDIKAADVGALATKQIASGNQPDVRLVKLIDSATGAGCSVLAANYDFNLQDVADAFVRAKQRGCDVRFITDGDTVDKSNAGTAGRYGRYPTDPDYVKPLGAMFAAKVPVHDDGSRGGIMHDKFAVVNGKQVWTGSWNMSHGDLAYWNHAILINSPQLAARYTLDFEYLWREFAPSFAPGNHLVDTSPAKLPTDHNVAGVEVYFPHADKATARLAQLLSGAQKSIHFLAFQFTGGPMADAVVERARAGVEVHGVFENNGACAGVYPDLLALNKSNVRVSRWGMGRIQGLRNFLHHKVFIIDGKTVALGSFNFSASADSSNDENLLIINDSSLASTFQKEYDLVETSTAKTRQPPPCKG